MGDSFLVRYACGSTSKVSDGSPVSGDIMLEAVETPSGCYFYAVSPDRVGTHSGDGTPLMMERPAVKDLPETAVEVLQKRNEELKHELTLLRARDELLTKQNEQLMDRLLSYADMAMEVLHAPREDAREGGERTSSAKASRGRRGPRADEGAEKES